MRIISGSAKGRKLLAPKSMRVRPTADRVKEALFNILSVLTGGFDACRVLDIFAGTGNLGIEALSRGATFAVFIDNHRDSVALIEKNLELAGFRKSSRIIQKDVLAALHLLSPEHKQYQLVFLDPPYERGLTEKTLGYLASSSLIDEQSIVVAEHSVHEQLPPRFSGLLAFDSRSYGDTAISFYRIEGQAMPHQHQPLTV